MAIGSPIPAPLQSRAGADRAGHPRCATRIGRRRSATLGDRRRYPCPRAGHTMRMADGVSVVYHVFSIIYKLVANFTHHAAQHARGDHSACGSHEPPAPAWPLACPNGGLTISPLCHWKNLRLTAKMATPAGIHCRNEINALRCQTGVRVLIETKGPFGTVSNRRKPERRGDRSGPAAIRTALLV